MNDNTLKIIGIVILTIIGLAILVNISFEGLVIIGLYTIICILIKLVEDIGKLKTK